MGGSKPAGSGRTLEDVLAHYGIRGMKWGIRRKNPSGPTAVEVATPPGRGVQTRGGSGQRASDDAVRTAVYKQVARKSGVSSLSNRQLQDLVTRLNLEQQYDRLRPRSASEKTVKFLSDILISVGKEEASKYVRSAASNQVKDALKSK